MYASVSTQQPAAICALKSSADAVHVLEAVRVGLVPRVTRRLTGHERGQIRPGTVWVWEEEECNMKRWTDGRRWGASRVGGGGFLVYTESSDVNTPPDSRAHSPNTFAQINGYYPTVPQREPLVKQTYSTTMKHPVTGKTKKFHVVGYSSKNNPQGDGQNALPLPHELPMLASLQVAPGIWPEAEKRRDSMAASSEASGSTGARQPVTAQANPPPSPAPSAQPSAEPVAGPSTSATPTQRSSSSAPISRSGEQRTSLPSPYGTPYHNPPAPRSAPPYPPSQQSLPTSERYHPYRERPTCLAPIDASAPAPPILPNEGRRVSVPSPPHPMPLSAPPYPPIIQTYPYPLNGHSAGYLPQAIRPPFPHQIMPPLHAGPPQMYADQFNHYNQSQHSYPYQSHHQTLPPPPLHSQTRHPPSRELMYPNDTSSASLDPNQPNRSPQISISSALSSDTAGSGRMTLPPLRVAIDAAGHRRTPSQSSRTSPGQSPLAGDRRELGELSKKVSL